QRFQIRPAFLSEPACLSFDRPDGCLCSQNFHATLRGIYSTLRRNRRLVPAQAAHIPNKTPEKPVARVEIGSDETATQAGHSEGSVMKSILPSATIATAVGLTGFSAHRATAAVGDNTTFAMQVSPGAASCLPNAQGRVTVSNVGPVENLHVEVTGLRKST